MSVFSHILGKFRATNPSLNDGDTSEARVNNTGMLLQDLGTRIAGEDIANDVQKTRYPGIPTYISTATTTVVKSGAGHLHSIVIGETAAGAITIYDNTAASSPVLAVIKSSAVEGTYLFDITFSTGLTIVTAAASKLSVSYS